MESYGYISSVENHAPLITRMMSEGMSARGMSRASDAALGKTRINAPFSDEQRADLYSRAGFDWGRDMTEAEARQLAEMHDQRLLRRPEGLLSISARSSWNQPSHTPSPLHIQCQLDPAY